MSTPTHSPLQTAIADLAHGRPLDASVVSDAFDIIMRGNASTAQVAALLMGMRVRGEDPSLVAAVAGALRRAMVQLPSNDPSALVDTCGTGGGSVTTFNISTAAALVAAGAGINVAKHGNRSFTSKSGSADVLEALGVNIDVSPEVMSAALASAGIVFMFAPRMHPSMRHVGPVRRELAIPTVMNVVGPLANPANAGRQVIGVADSARLQMIAEALSILGTVHSLVVYGEPGMDEISPIGTTRVIEIRNGTTASWDLDPATFGYAAIDPTDLAGGEPQENAALIERLLEGESSAGAEAAVVLNAGAAIYIGGAASSYAEGIDAARQTIRSGKALDALERLRQAMPLAAAES